MKAQQAWEMNLAELERKEKELYDQIFKLRFQLATGQMDNPLKLRVVKKDLARVKTVLTARRKETAQPAPAKAQTVKPEPTVPEKAVDAASGEGES